MMFVTAFTNGLAEEVPCQLEQIAITRSPLTGLRMKDAQWVEPMLTARVRHLAGAKYLRHAVVRALE